MTLNLLHSKWRSKVLQILTLFRIFFGGSTENVPGKLKSFSGKVPMLTNLRDSMVKRVLKSE